MAIVKQGSTTLNAGAKGDKGEQGEAGVSGGTSPSIRVVTNQTELTTVLSGVEKELSIQADFTLSSDVTIPDGAVISDGGGVMDVNGYEITFVNNSFNFPYPRTVIDLYHDTTPSTYTSSPAVGGETTLDIGVKLDDNFVYYLKVDGVLQKYGYSDGSGQSYVFNQTGVTTVIEFTNTLLPLEAGEVVFLEYVLEASRSRINDTSTFSNGDINLRCFGMVDDGVVSTIDIIQSGTDNRNVIMEAQKIYNLSGGKATLTKGNYAYSVMTSRGTVGDTPTNMFIEGSASFEMIGDVKLLVLPSILYQTDAFTMYKSINSFLKGGVIIGDLRNHIFQTEDGFSEGADCHGVIIGYKSKYSLMETPVTDFAGDNIYFTSGGSNILVNTEALVEADFQVGVGGNPLSTIEDDGSFTVSSLWAYSKLIDITSYSALSRNIMIVGSHAFGGETGFVNNTIMIAFYDEADTFIIRTELVDIYSDIPTNPDYKQFRLIARIPSVWSDFYASVVVDDAPSNMTVSPKYIRNGVRQGVSNISKNTILKGIDFKNNGERYSHLQGSPSYHIDIEDGYQRRRDIEITQCTFTNGKGGCITAVGAKSLRIHNNTFNYETDPYYSGNDINLVQVHEGMFFNNVVKGKTLVIGRQSRVYGNTFWDCTISDNEQGGILENNTFYNSGLGKKSTASRTVYPSYAKTLYKGNKIILNTTQVLNTIFFTLTEPDTQFVDTIIKCNGFEPIIATNGNSSPYNGYIKGFRIEEAPSTYEAVLPVMDMEDMYSSCNIAVTFGGARDMFLKDSVIDGYLWFALRNHPATNGDSSTFTTITVENNKISPTSTSLFYAFHVSRADYLADVNFVVKDCKIEVPSGNNFIRTFHYGTTLFENVKFTTPTIGQSLDLSLVITNGDTVTLKDCEFINVTSIILRDGDKILFTKPNSLCPEFATNALALAELGEGYYYKLATGEFKVTYTP